MHECRRGLAAGSRSVQQAKRPGPLDKSERFLFSVDSVSVTTTLSEKRTLTDPLLLCRPSSDKQYLELPKKSEASGFFDDGLTFLFKDGEELASVRPRHIHFEVSTSTADMMETCDVRLYSVEKVEPKANKNESGRLLQDGD